MRYIRPLGPATRPGLALTRAGGVLHGRMGTAFTENDSAQLAYLLASLFMAHRHRFPYRKQLDPVRVLGPVSGQTPGSRRRRKKR